MAKKTHIMSDETGRALVEAVIGLGARTVPIYDEELGYYTDSSIASWLGGMRDGKSYGIKVPKGSAVACTKTSANEGIAVPTPGIVGRPAVDPYIGLGPFIHVDVNATVDVDGKAHVVAIDGDGRYDPHGKDVFVLTPTLYTVEVEDSSNITIIISDTRRSDMSVQPGGLLPDGTVRPFMLYAKYPLSTDTDGNPRSVTGAQVKGFVSHDIGVSLCKTASTGYSFRNTADDWYVKTMFMMKYATKNSQAIFAGCTGYDIQCSPTVAETGQTRVIIAKDKADALIVGSSVILGTHAPSSGTANNDRGQSYNYDIVGGACITRKEAYDSSNVAVYLDVSTAFDTKTTYLLSTIPWACGACDDVEGDGSPTSCTDSKQPFKLQGIELAHGMYEVMGNVLLSSTGSGWDVYVNHDTKNEKAGALATGAELVGHLGASTSDVSIYGLYPKTVGGFMLQQGSGASTTTGICDQIWKNADTATGLREWLSLGDLWNRGNAGLFFANCSCGTGDAWWGYGSRLSANGRSKG